MKPASLPDFCAPTGMPVEFELQAESGAGDLANEVEVDMEFTHEDGQTWKMPAYWAGADRFRVRFAAPREGRYSCVSSSTAQSDRGLHGRTGSIQASAAGDAPALYRKGHLHVDSDGRKLVHENGDPFFWSGDTWWMGLAPRLSWPHGFKMLTEDRVNKGFSLIQIVAGPLPEFHVDEAGTWHPQQSNEGGWPWERNWERINPAFYDAADMRIAHLVDRGLVPCIFGMWGFYLPLMGIDRVRRHWRNLVARYAAYPVIFSVAGEINLATYHLDRHEEHRVAQVEGWTDLARYVRGLDPYRNPVTAHPGANATRDCVLDDSVVDIDLVMTSHWGYHTMPKETLAMVQQILGMKDPVRYGLEGAIDTINMAIGRDPKKPVVNSEPPYEGIMGGNWQDVQRFGFWTTMLAGAMGYTYGAQGLWQASSLAEPFSATFANWGHGFWEEAMHYPGGTQIARARSFFERFRWWELQPRIEPGVTRRLHHAAEIAGQLRIYYLPSKLVDVDLQGVVDAQLQLLDGPWVASFHDPRTGRDVAAGTAEPDLEGWWTCPQKPTTEDWVLVLQRGEETP